MTFDNLELHPHITSALKRLDFTKPTPVQEKAIPVALLGRDIMGCAQTGTGKTAAFTIPIVHKLLSNPLGKPSKAPRVLILAPTRELADQILTSIKGFTLHSSLKAGLVVGGLSYGPQIQMLQRPLDILVATPGRLIDHMGERRVDLSQVETLVLDEADRMLDMGFITHVERIIDSVSPKHQTLFFSATFDKNIHKLAKRFLTDAHEIHLATSTDNHKDIKQVMYFTKGRDHKLVLLEELLARDDLFQALVFMRTKFATDRLAKVINQWGGKTQAAALHGDMRQSARNRVIGEMHRGNLRVLVATDVAARGLDVKELTHVINFDLPQNPEDYTHRIGRTGRAGAKGEAISFVSNEERHLLHAIEKFLQRKLEAENEDPMPEAEANKARLNKKAKPKNKGKPQFKERSSGGRDRSPGNRDRSPGNRDRSPGNRDRSAVNKDDGAAASGLGNRDRTVANKDHRPVETAANDSRAPRVRHKPARSTEGRKFGEKSANSSYQGKDEQKTSRHSPKKKFPPKKRNEFSPNTDSKGSAPRDGQTQRDGQAQNQNHKAGGHRGQVASVKLTQDTRQNQSHASIQPRKKRAV